MIHQIEIRMNPDDYKKMVLTYQLTGNRDYFHANIIIDGVMIPNVGIRLKGYSSLFSIRGVPEHPGQESNHVPPKPRTRPGKPPPEKPPAMPEVLPKGSEIRPDGPWIVPFLIVFDRYEDGQRYQGRSEIAIRGRSHKGYFEDPAFLSEYLSYYIFASTGQPVPQAAYAGVRVNNDFENLYVITEHINKGFIKKHFPNSDGILYKAMTRSNFHYRGEDPTRYTDSFEQKTKEKDEDFTPLIDFIRFVSKATDKRFREELSSYLDVDGFASYLALNNLLVNMDSLGGTGHNYYLYYDLKAEKFSILAWDMNESFGQFWQFSGINYMLDPYYNTRSRIPINPLKDRFLRNDQFRALYEKKYRDLYRQVYGGNLIDEKLDQLAAQFINENTRRNLIDRSKHERGIRHTKEFIMKRTEYLLSLESLNLYN